MQKKLIMIPSKMYNQFITTHLKEVSSQYEKICYVSLNKTYKSLLQMIEKEDIDSKRFYFMDFITPQSFKTNQDKQCLFLNSFELNNFAEKFLDMINLNDIDVVIFDSMSSFLMHKSNDEVENFLNYVLYFLEELNISIDLLSLKEDANKNAIKQMTMRVDKVIDNDTSHPDVK